MLIPNTTRQQKVAYVAQGARWMTGWRVVRLGIMALVAVVVLGRVAVETALLNGQGVETTGRVIAIEAVTPPRSSVVQSYQVRFTYTVDQRNYTGDGTLSPRDGAGLTTTDTLPVRYLSAYPAFARPLHQFTQDAPQHGVALALAAVLGLGYSIARRNARRTTP